MMKNLVLITMLTFIMARCCASAKTDVTQQDNAGMCQFTHSQLSYNNRDSLLYEKALDCWFQYSLRDDVSYLKKAKQYLDSIEYKPVSKKVFDLNLSVFYLLKDYKSGLKYLDSFKSSDFAISYKKDMYIKTFEMAIAELQCDTVNRNRLYTELINEIELYLNENPNQESLCDLITAKMKIESKDTIMNDIENIRLSGLYEDKVIELLIQILNAENY